MLDKANFSIKIFVGVTLALIILVYGYYKTRDLLSGPVIKIHSPKNGEIFRAPLIEISGVAENISRLTLNDRVIFIDENGNFREKLLLSGGYNIIDFKAEDKFGEKTGKTLEVILK